MTNYTDEDIKRLKAEAVKKFAEQLKYQLDILEDYHPGDHKTPCMVNIDFVRSEIDSLAEEEKE